MTLKRLLLPNLMAATAIVSVAPAYGQGQQTFQFDIPVESLATAVRAFAQVTGAQVIFDGAALEGKKSHAVRGTFTVDRGLDELLRSSGATARRNAQGILVVTAATTTAAAASPGAGDFRGKPIAADEAADIVVTGTNIRGGTPAGSPLTTYDRGAIERTGATDIAQFARTMPENFSGVDANSYSNSNASHALLPSGANTFAGASFDLHGIGPNATLTLLNGNRLGSAGYDGSLTDISVLPLSIVDHIEVLGDGASAIYGADAIAGVVNIVTRKHFDGAETSASYGTSTSGGDSQYTASQIVGHVWQRGEFLIDYEHVNHDGLYTSQRDYIPDLGGPNSIIPRDYRNSVFMSGGQDIGTSTRITATGIFTERHFSSVGTEVSVPEDFVDSTAYSGHVRQYGGTLGLDRKLGGDWHLAAVGSYSKVDQDYRNIDNDVFEGEADSSQNTTHANSFTLGANLTVNGTLLLLPGGPLKIAVGASYRREGFDQSRLVAFSDGSSSFVFVPQSDRNVASVFGELALPIIGGDNPLPIASRLDVTASVRYDRYSDFGSTTNPKVGVEWELRPGFLLRGSYGTSFRAPQLSDLNAAIGGEAAALPNPASPTGFTDTLLLSGGNKDLKAETSRSFTIGFDAKPAFIPGLKLSATYYDVRFVNRIASAGLTELNVLSDPKFAPFISYNPSISLVNSFFDGAAFEGDFGNPDGSPAGPGAVMALFDMRPLNYASSKTSGLGVNGEYRAKTGLGELAVIGAVNRLFKNSYQTDPASQPFEYLNTYGEPTKWKGRGTATWERRGFSVSLSANYTGSYKNNLFSPATRISAWTTEDLQIGYAFSDTSPGLLNGLRATLAILNITDAKPPFAPVPQADLAPGVPSIPYDSTNASPLGRFISFSVTKRW